MLNYGIVSLGVTYEIFCQKYTNVYTLLKIFKGTPDNFP